ncbi:MAG: hypothetical protein AUJ49_13430 [Desulfovibrionaceae bacterium CG1_02_65_16]|nr:MAG: hypothetical protein AUJ49_13430 [Desulfovibrionaceae bacterium CG1_02_65_16]
MRRALALFTTVPLLLAVLCVGTALAAGHAPKGFNEAAFRTNFASGLASRPNAPALKPENIHVQTAEKAASFGGMDVYVVKGELAPENGLAQPFTLFVSADGKFYVPDIVDLGTGRSILKPARERVRHADLQGFGHTVFHGSGKANVVFVSDPFCPYCREAFAYLMNKGASYADFRLAHFPLSSHIGADIACSIMAWAAENDAEHLADYVRFAYLELPAPHVADRSQPNLDKARAEVADAFLKRFPNLSALGADGDALVQTLQSSPYAQTVAADIARATGLDINGTPIIFVGETRVEGFDAPRLDSLLK